MFFWQNIMEPSMTHPATSCINLLLNLQNKLDIKERGQRRWSHRFIFAHKLVPHLSSQHAIAHMAKTPSFHISVIAGTKQGMGADKIDVPALNVIFLQRPPT
jgi:hypothetical protein